MSCLCASFSLFWAEFILTVCLLAGSRLLRVSIALRAYKCLPALLNFLSCLRSLCAGNLTIAVQQLFSPNVCVCIYIYIYIHIHICMYVCMYVCMYDRNVAMVQSQCICVCVCVYVYMYVCMCVCVCIYIYIYIYTPKNTC